MNVVLKIYLDTGDLDLNLLGAIHGKYKLHHKPK